MDARSGVAEAVDLAEALGKARAAAAGDGIAHDAAQFATGALIQVIAQAAAMRLQDTLQARQRADTLAQAVTAKAVSEIMSADIADVPKRIQQANAAMDALRRGTGDDAGSAGALVATLRALLEGAATEKQAPADGPQPGVRADGAAPRKKRGSRRKSAGAG